jgi:hypothetical protein
MVAIQRAVQDKRFERLAVANDAQAFVLMSFVVSVASRRGRRQGREFAHE